MMRGYLSDDWNVEPDWSWRTFDLCLDDERFVSCNRCFERLRRACVVEQDEHARECLRRWVE